MAQVSLLDPKSRAALKCIETVRRAPGTVREIQLVEHADRYAASGKVREWVNNHFGFEALLLDPEASSNEGESLDVVVTNSNYRLLLDLLVSDLPGHKHLGTHDTRFHISTFAESISADIDLEDPSTIRFTFGFPRDALAIDSPLAARAREILAERENHGVITKRLMTTQDLIAGIRAGESFWATGLRDVCVIDFDWVAIREQTGLAQIEDLDATTTVFVGNCNFAGARFVGTTRFSGAVFNCPTVDFMDAQFELDREDLSFRNARLFTNEALFDGASFSSSRFGRTVSFEDARISPHSSWTRVNDSLIRMSFNRLRSLGVSLDFYQLFAPMAELSFIDADINERINFDDARLARLLFISINTLDSLALRLHSEPGVPATAELVIENCLVRSLVQVDEVGTLSLRGTIIDGHLVTQWCKEGADGATRPNHTLLDAINRNNDTHEERSQQFLMLKQNFANLGQYDLEDEAFSRFMSTRRRDRTTDSIMSAIKVISNYGISPGQVLKSIAITVLAFALLYWFTSFGFPSWYSFGAATWPDVLGGSLALSISSFMGLSAPVSVADRVPAMIALAEGIVGWFFLGLFSVAIVRRTLR